LFPETANPSQDSQKVRKPAKNCSLRCKNIAESAGNRLTVEKYSREVPVAELEKEDFNLNIRRYVDNSPPPEPHDVRAHLHGGIPVAEITELDGYFGNCADVKALLFKDRDAKYGDFAAGIASKDDIKRVIESAPGVAAKHTAFHAALDKWWKKNLPEIERLPDTQNVFGLRRHAVRQFRSMTQRIDWLLPPPRKRMIRKVLLLQVNCPQASLKLPQIAP
jgi:hypothetical protein